MIPEVHKQPWAWRPIVPTHSSPTTQISKVVDIALAVMLPRIPHLNRSTAEWIRAFNNGLKKHTGYWQTWLVTGDVVAFYTNVDMETIHRSMESILLGSRMPAKRAAALPRLVQVVTHQNFYMVDGELFHQTNGLAMGSSLSGTIANLAMARKEKRFVGREGILTYTRYVDDIFAMIEAKNVHEVRHILREISEGFAPLQINWKVSKTHAIYLDAECKADIRKGFTHRPYRKPMSQHVSPVIFCAPRARQKRSSNRRDYTAGYVMLGRARLQNVRH